MEDLSNQLLKIGVDPKEYKELSDEEKEVVNQVIRELSMTTPSSSSTNESLINDSTNSTYEDLYNIDYDEIPVDFETFITEDEYLGKSTRNGQFLYPFWKEEAKRIFSRWDINEVALSGSIGTGKTTSACIMMAYHLYKTMCMKDPQAFFNLSPNSEIVYAFINNTLGSSYGVAYNTIQGFLTESPWFLKHGRLVGRDSPMYVPEKGFGFVVGSRPQHTLGRHVICLTGDTQIITSDGIYSLEELENKEIKVFTYNESTNQVELSEECFVRNTGYSNEIIEITLEDGSIIKCTPDHKLLTKRGYVCANDLLESDEIIEGESNYEDYL